MGSQAVGLGGVAEFVIARNPEPGSTLPYLLLIPLPDRQIVLKARDTWPRTSKIYCHRETDWPAEPEIVERVPVRSCTRRGGAIDLVLDRGRENRSQFILTRVRGGREAIFWQSARTTKQARPNVTLPTARAHGLADLQIVVDAHERYAWKFADQQATTTVRALPAGDYAVELDGELVASVERKSVADLASSLSTGRLKFALADLASLPRAAVVVEGRYSEIFGLAHVRGSVLADGLAECAAAWPQVPIQFCENRKLAQEWTFRFLGATLAAARERADLAAVGDGLRTVEVDVTQLDAAPRSSVRRPAAAGSALGAADIAGGSAAQVRAWALAEGLPVARRGRLGADIVAAYLASTEVGGAPQHSGGSTLDSRGESSS